MPEPDYFAEDIAAIVNAEFSKPVVFFDEATDQPLPAIRGLYDETYLTIDPDTQIEHSSQHARVTIIKSQAPVPLKRRRTVLEVAGVRRRVYDLQEFGQGTVTLLLHDVT